MVFQKCPDFPVHPDRLMSSGGAYNNEVFGIYKCIGYGFRKTAGNRKLVLIPEYPLYFLFSLFFPDGRRYMKVLQFSLYCGRNIRIYF